MSSTRLLVSLVVGYLVVFSGFMVIHHWPREAAVEAAGFPCENDVTRLKSDAEAAGSSDAGALCGP